MMLKIQAEKNSVIFPLKVIPNASKDEVVGVLNSTLKIKVTKAPESGKANKSCEKLLASFFEVKKQAVQIVSGHTSPIKTVQIQNISPEKILKRLKKSL
ncbi:DUF167 domain-containing protein [Candidatus Auribacterota bacterium]